MPPRSGGGGQGRRGGGGLRCGFPLVLVLGALTMTLSMLLLAHTLHAAPEGIGLVHPHLPHLSLPHLSNAGQRHRGGAHGPIAPSSGEHHLRPPHGDPLFHELVKPFALAATTEYAAKFAAKARGGGRARGRRAHPRHGIFRELE